MKLAMTAKQFAKQIKVHGTLRGMARGTGLSYRQVMNCHEAAVAAGLMPRLKNGRPVREEMIRPTGRLRALGPVVAPLPTGCQVTRYIFTSAQNNTMLHDALWTNLEVLAEHYKAKLHVSRFAYNKSGLGASGDKAADFSKKEHVAQTMWWDKRILPLLSDERMEIAPDLMWCGEMNILPTATNPLSGLESYTGRRSGIFPHVKIAMRSIASARDDATKFNYTTGAVTLRNYIHRKAGLKAEFHHVYGALLVEVNSAGDWWCRQLNGDSEGTVYDLDVCVKGGKLTTFNRVEAITWGDIHVAEKDDTAHAMAWDNGGILDTLRPKVQFLHDVLHFRGRSHHDMKNPHMMFKRFVEGSEDVQCEVVNVGRFLDRSQRDWCLSVVVDSNHHHHLGRWLQEQDGRRDPINAEFWFEMQHRVYAAIRANRSPNYLVEALLQTRRMPPKVRFLNDGESFIICEDAHGGIECGQHGDLGPNGSRGSALSFSRMGRRMNRGHTHSADITDGVYTSGTSGELNPDWTSGPGSWSHSHIVTYPNGKRAILTCWKGQWRA